MYTYDSIPDEETKYQTFSVFLICCCWSFGKKDYKCGCNFRLSSSTSLSLLIFVYLRICAHKHVPVISHFLGKKDGSNTFRFLSESLPSRPLSFVSNSDSQPIPFCLVHDSVRSAATFTCPCIASFDDCGYRMSEWFSSEAQSINSGEAVVELPNWSIWLWTEDPLDRIAVVPAALWNHAHWYVHPTHRAVWWNSRRDNDPRCHFFPASRLCSPFTSIFVHIRHPYESMVHP